jgi:hypothetical protein
MCWHNGIQTMVNKILKNLHILRNITQALAQAESCGYVLAAELLAIGVDFSFAPVLDLDYAILMKNPLDLSPLVSTPHVLA